MSFTRAEDEKKHNRVVRAILTVLAMFGAGSNAIKMRHETELEKEMSQKERDERNKSNVEREQELAK